MDVLPTSQMMIMGFVLIVQMIAVYVTLQVQEAVIMPVMLDSISVEGNVLSVLQTV